MLSVRVLQEGLEAGVVGVGEEVLKFTCSCVQEPFTVWCAKSMPISAEPPFVQEFLFDQDGAIIGLPGFSVLLGCGPTSPLNYVVEVIDCRFNVGVGCKG
jgi:hypothetical protein